MPFVKRNAAGEIVAASQEPSGECTEAVDHHDPALRNFLAAIAREQSTLTQSDLDFVRVVEDLVELLVAKNYILFTDLPEKAQEKMRHRQALRGKMGTHLDLLGEDDEGFF